MLRKATCSVKVNGEWYASTGSPQPHQDRSATSWDAGPALAIARLIQHDGGDAIECQLNNRGSTTPTLHAWRPPVVAGGRSALPVGEDPWPARALPWPPHIRHTFASPRSRFSHTGFTSIAYDRGIHGSGWTAT